MSRPSVKPPSLNPQSHFARLSQLVKLEEAEELAQFREEFLKRTPQEREVAGKALLNLVLKEIHYSPAGHYLLSFSYADKRRLPLYSPDIGDLVSVSQDPSGFFDTPTGTVYEKDREVITVAFDWEPPDWIQEKEIYHLNISGSRFTAKKIHEALKQAALARDNRLAFLRDLCLGAHPPAPREKVPVSKLSFFNPHLNLWQKEAVSMALGSGDVALIHGPPGTGKTTVLIEIIQQAVASGQFVFATAPSNTASDHLLECLVASGIPALRLGHPARILRHLRDHTLDFKLAGHPLAPAITQLEEQLEGLHHKRHRSRRVQRGEKINFSRELERLKSEIKALQSQLFDQVIREAPVIVGTLVSGGDPILRRKSLDLLVMDEASQATEPVSWIPILRAQKVIFAGDHYQLPPTVISKKALEQGLGVTLFERLHAILGDEWKGLLRVQYRMNEKIMNFSSREFYGGQLIADETVRHHVLADLPNVQRDAETEEAFLYLDTAGRGFEEKLEPGSESRYNLEEANLVLRHLKKLLERSVRPEQIAVVSPYSAQVRLIASRSPDPGIEVDSVDGFQGREKEAVIVSLVRSNTEGEMGFLTDTRRMNVAMTRAKRKLLVIGDSATLGRIDFYRDFIKYAESIGAYRSSWEEIA